MYKGQKSIRGGIEDFLCPFTDMYMTCGPNEGDYHKGTMSVDVRGAEKGVRYAYYAPATSVCKITYPDFGQAVWQTTNPVRCSNGYVGIVTYTTCHDDSFDAYPGLVIPQGNQLGNMGTKSPLGNVTGVHCHFEGSQSDDTSRHKNKYGNWEFNYEVDPEDLWFMDNTNILNGYGNWKTTADVPVQDNKFINLPPDIEERYIYDVNTKQKLDKTLKPKKFGGLSYKVFSFPNDGYYAEIETLDYGNVLVRVTSKTPITNTPQYQHGNY